MIIIDMQHFALLHWDISVRRGVGDRFEFEIEMILFQQRMGSTKGNPVVVLPSIIKTKLQENKQAKLICKINRK